MNNNRRSINEEELDIFFKLIGSGIWYLQHVENALTTYIVVKGEIKEVGRVSSDLGEKMHEKHRRNTLGTSIRIANEMGIISEKLTLFLNKFKDERDWLVHKSMVQNGDDLYSNIEREELFHRIYMFSENAINLQKLISEELQEYVVSKGVSKDWIVKKAIDEINKKQGR